MQCYGKITEQRIGGWGCDYRVSVTDGMRTFTLRQSKLCTSEM